MLTPLADALGHFVLQAQKIHGDDTPIRALGGRGKKSHTGRLWVYVRDDRPSGDDAEPAVWFQYSADRSRWYMLPGPWTLNPGLVSGKADFARVTVMTESLFPQSTPTSTQTSQAYQLYVELEEARPKVWRRFLVPTTIELPRGHTTLLAGMGWEGGHVHVFLFGHDSYGR